MQTTETVTASYDIPAANYPAFEAKMVKMNRKASKLGLDPIRYAVMSTRLVKRPVDEWTIRNAPDIYDPYFTVAVTGNEVKYNGWALIASLEGDEGGTVVRTVPGKETPESYRHADATLCEHCNKKRTRSATFVVKNDDGTYKQVGRQCLADFLGGNDPHRFAAMAEWLQELKDWAEDEEIHRGKYIEPTYRITDFLAWVAATVRNDGYVTGTYAREHDVPSTASVAWGVMSDPMAIKRLPNFVPTEADTALAEAIYVHCLQAMNAKTEPSEYEHNMGLLLRREYVSWKNRGMIASAYGMYKRDTEAAVERKQTAQRANEWLGEVGKRETFTATLTSVREFEDRGWGVNFLYRFLDADGNVILWWTTTGADIADGEVVTFKATVKEHGEYKGQRQTKVARLVLAASAKAA